MTTPKNSFRKTFIEEQKNKTDNVLEEAQRLVNLYRHADSFGEDFSERLDQMLLSASPEVQTTLSNILGGQVVRRYCDYLKGQTGKVPDHLPEDTSVSFKQGYLPDPDQDLTVGVSPVNTTQPIQTNKELMDMNRQELKELLKAQSENFATILQQLKQNTHEEANRQTKRFVAAMKQEVREKYADVIESGSSASTSTSGEMEGS